MASSGPNREESVGSQHQDHFLNLERRRDREVSVHMTHTSRSHSRIGSHVLHGEETRNLQVEIDHLHRKLRRKQRRESLSSSRSESGDDDSYSQELLIMNLFPIGRNVIIGKGVEVRPIGA